MTSKFTTETGLGYFVDEQGRVTDFYDAGVGEHDLHAPRVEAVDVESRDEIESMDIHPKYQDGVDWDANLADAKQARIKKVKKNARGLLKQTDWQVVREMEKGVPLKEGVKDYRDEVRTLTEQAESDINDLSNSEDVATYSVEWPTPP